MYLGLCVNNQDPERRGRVQVFVPHIMPALYNNWNEAGKDIQINCVGDNIEGALSSDIIEKLIEVLPWAEAASPIIGTSAPGNLVNSGRGIGEAIGGAVGGALFGAPGQAAGAAVGGAVGDFFDQSPTTSAPVAVPPPTTGGPLKFSMKPGGTGGNWAGAAAKLSTYLPRNFTTSSQKRDVLNGNQKSDHNWFAANAYAVDLGLNTDFGGSTAAANQTAIQIVNSLRAEVGKPPISNWSEVSSPYNERTPDGYRVQVIWQSANHYDHIHVGAKWTGQGVPQIAASAAPNPVVPQVASDGLVNTNNQGPSSSSGAPNKSETGDVPTGSAKDATTGLGGSYAQGQSVAPAITAGGQGISGTVSGKGTSSGAGLYSDNFVNFVKSKEGFYEKSYWDYKQHTVGYGTKAKFPGEVISKQEAEIRLRAELDKAASQTNAILERKGITNLSQSQKEALMSFTYNGGVGMTQQLLDGGGGRRDWSSISEGMKLYNKAGGKPLEGLTNRRNAEIEFGNSDGSGGFTPSESTLSAEMSPTSPPSVIDKTYPHGPVASKNTNDMPAGLFAYPSPGAMLWVFFREGNPLYPVYFAASYGQTEWSAAYRQGSPAPRMAFNGEGEGGGYSHGTMINPVKGGACLEFGTDYNGTDASKDNSSFGIFNSNKSNLMIDNKLYQIYANSDRLDYTEDDYFQTVKGYKESWIQGNSNDVVMGNVTVKIGEFSQQAMDALKELEDFSNELNQTLMSNGSK